jgi:hypothetical protein
VQGRLFSKLPLRSGHKNFVNRIWYSIQKGLTLDERFRHIADDLARYLPEEYEVRDVTPMKQEMVWDEEEEKDYVQLVPIDLVEVADFVGIVTVLPATANPVGKDLKIISPVKPKMISNPAGLAEWIAPIIVETAELRVKGEMRQANAVTSP